ncbi:MAG: hypothetical protein QF903_07255 [Planctomycetota bacterium]|jgi:hypothetical protein|nr:hypothetical protein [Planctomycetota bacterium]MDP6763112.1 hypothetical protein [Planctomycetota bacterium]MDP6989262.1 hypothetical protein [Planctomycetota bacterium]
MASSSRASSPFPSLVVSAALGLAGAAPAQEATRLADAYVEAVTKLNEEHRRKPRGNEEELAKRLPRKAARSLERLLELDEAGELEAALRRCSTAALDLALVGDFDALRLRLAELAGEEGAPLDVALARPRFLLIGQNGLSVAYLTHFAEVLDAILDAYDEVFGFEEWSKVPGKKLRVRVHLEERITSPPHFAPQFPFHSEIDFPVVDPDELRSPTSDGKFLFYGLCHELGHVIAMWGSPSHDTDHHAWAHYTGVTITEHLTGSRSFAELGEPLRDAQYGRTLAKEREAHRTTEPSLDDRDGVLATLIALHDAVGAKAVGTALNHLDREEEHRRVNGVRYHSFEKLAEGLLATLRSPKARRAVSELLP